MPTWAISAASRSASPGCSSCMPALMLNYMGQGAMMLSLDPAAADAGARATLLLPRAREHAPAARHPRHLRHDHRQPGGDLGRLLGDPAGDAARLHPAPPDPAHQRGGDGPDLHPGGQLGADGDGDPARPLLPELERTSPPPTASRSPARCSSTPACSPSSCSSLWKWKPWLAVPVLAIFFLRRHRLFRAPTSPRCPTAAGSRCWSACSPSPCSPPGRAAAS